MFVIQAKDCKYLHAFGWLKISNIGEVVLKEIERSNESELDLCSKELDDCIERLHQMKRNLTEVLAIFIGGMFIGVILTFLGKTKLAFIQPAGFHTYFYRALQVQTDFTNFIIRKKLSSMQEI